MTTYQRPLSTSFSTNTISTSASTALAGTKWRKGLARLSKKWKNSNSKHCSPLSATAAAAATEKLIRRPTTTIQTEDLTASQFAYMTGIKIKRGRNHQEENDDMIMCEFNETEDDDDTEDDNEYSDNDYTTHMLPISLDHRQRQHLTTRMGTTKMQHGSISGMTSWSYSSSTTTNRFPPIWDVRFWQNHHHHHQEQPGDESHQGKTESSPCTGLSLMSSSNSRYSDISTTESISTMDTALSSTSLSSSLSTSTKPRVFHKGRFQIVLGGDDEDHCTPIGEPLLRTVSSDVVEWHRKRTLTH